MDAISYTRVRNNLAKTMDRVVQDHEPIVITRQKGESVVLMSLEDFNAWQETAYLQCRRLSAHPPAP
jgi:antitoxin YefM